MSRDEALEVLGLSAGASLEDIEKATKRQARRNRRRPAQVASISDAAVALNCEWCLPQIHVEVASGKWAEIPTPVRNNRSLLVCMCSPIRVSLIPVLIVSLLTNCDRRCNR